MKEPTFDEYGYPTDETLETIEKWPFMDCKGWFSFIGEAWYWPEMFDVNGNTVSASTGGWSGNEDIINAMERNELMWVISWKCSQRGGHYEFEIPKEN